MLLLSLLGLMALTRLAGHQQVMSRETQKQFSRLPIAIISTTGDFNFTFRTNCVTTKLNIHLQSRFDCHSFGQTTMAHRTIDGNRSYTLQWNLLLLSTHRRPEIQPFSADRWDFANPCLALDDVLLNIRKIPLR